MALRRKYDTKSIKGLKELLAFYLLNDDAKSVLWFIIFNCHLRISRFGICINKEQILIENNFLPKFIHSILKIHLPQFIGKAGLSIHSLNSALAFVFVKLKLMTLCNAGDGVKTIYIILDLVNRTSSLWTSRLEVAFWGGTYFKNTI